MTLNTNTFDITNIKNKLKFNFDLNKKIIQSRIIMNNLRIRILFIFQQQILGIRHGP